MGKAKFFGERQDLDKSVYDVSKERLDYCLDICDTLVVMFSGGKDSTALLMTALEVAEARNRLPLEVFFGDEEGLAPETVDYVRRISQDDRINLTWSCVPIHSRNACSRSHPFWYSWDPREKDKWMRELPPEAITTEDRPDVPWGNIAEQMPIWYPQSRGTVIQCLGRRTQESYTRWMNIAQRGGERSFLAKSTGSATSSSTGKSKKYKHIQMADPIYDWQVEDVWTAPFLYDWDYNRIYDVYSRLGIKPTNQRIGPPFAEECLNLLWVFKHAWADLWDRMQVRLPGVATAARYFHSEVYDRGGNKHLRPAEGETWREYVTRLLFLWEPEYRAKVASNLTLFINHHDKVCVEMTGKTEPIPERGKHPRSGISWELLAKIVKRGVFKGRALVQMMQAGEMYFDGKDTDEMLEDARESDEMEAGADA